MPVWHARTKALQEAGRVKMVGIIEEQHPDRARLFMQWKEMDWPILVDSLDLLGVSVVPITMFIDEKGIVRSTRGRFDDLEEFLNTDYGVEDDEKTADSSLPDMKELRERAVAGGFVERLAYADALVTWSSDSAELDEAVTQYQELLREQVDNGDVQFRAGVAYRKRFDMVENGDPVDFREAVLHWSGALAINPNQYIWRRRIQQYGPRLDKPYPFYDWVSTARSEIRARGEEPIGLDVEPGGAEIAHPSRVFSQGGGVKNEERVKNLDPEVRIKEDVKKLIQMTVVSVPATKGDDALTVRVHLLLRPDEGQKAHWNNEADGVFVWIDPPAGVEVSPQSVRLANPTGEAVSREEREVEFELRGDGGGVGLVRGYVLYYVCEDVDGVCYYLRQDFRVAIGE